MRRTILLAAFCAASLIAWRLYFSPPSPLSIAFGGRSAPERNDDGNIAAVIGIERNDSIDTETADTPDEAGKTEIRAESNDRAGEEKTHIRIFPSPPASDPLRLLLGETGYPFASGEIQKSGCPSNQICAVSGLIRGVNFEQLYCRAAAFAGGKDMPKFPPNPTQRYEEMQFWRSREPFGLDAIYIKNEEFVLSGSLFADRRILKGRLTLSMSAERKFSCGIGSGWSAISLPLNCAARRNESEIGCSLDYRALIESLTGVAAKATEPERRQEIETLRDNLMDRFRNRIYDRTKIEEHDLRGMF